VLEVGFLLVEYVVIRFGVNSTPIEKLGVVLGWADIECPIRLVDCTDQRSVGRFFPSPGCLLHCFNH